MTAKQAKPSQTAKKRKRPAARKGRAAKADYWADPQIREALSFYLSRAHYGFVYLLRRVQQDMGLDTHLRPGTGHVLYALFENDNCIIKDIAERSKLSFGTLTGLLNRMETHGLVKRARCKEDARAVRVRLTPLGKSLEPHCRKLHERLKKTMHAALTDAQRVQLRELLDRLVCAMNKEERRLRKKQQASLQR